MRSLYRTVMDSAVNPLRHLLPAQRFQVMLFLSVMWTVIFCTAAGVWLLYDELLIGHALVILGVFVTDYSFRRARKQASNRNHLYPDEDY